MEALPDSSNEIIVRADEVDDSGTDISLLQSTDSAPLDHQIEARRLHDAQPTNQPKPLGNAIPPSLVSEPHLINTKTSPPTSEQPTRPNWSSKDIVAPPPPPTPPPPAPPNTEPLLDSVDVGPAPPIISTNGNGATTDSLSLAELRKIVKELPPREEPTEYAYVDGDTRSFAEELEEWFQYSREDRLMLLRAREALMRELNEQIPEKGDGEPWAVMSDEEKEDVVKGLVRALQGERAPKWMGCVEALVAVAAGVWWVVLRKRYSGARREDDVDELWEDEFKVPNKAFADVRGQLVAIRAAAGLLCRCGAVEVLWPVLKELCESDLPYSATDEVFLPTSEEESSSLQFYRERQLGAVLTILYFIVESGRTMKEKGAPMGEEIRKHIAALDPNILQYLAQLVARLRWDDSMSFPLTRILLLFWKSMLLIFGNSKELSRAKQVLCHTEKSEEDQNDGFLTASPLDYHIFRQEITSKYPAYNPPLPLVPIEINHNSILPPLPNHASRTHSHDHFQSFPGTNINGVEKSIFHQPVHISTPAPSPPPSPAGPGGKGGKKQNYQTNNNFPFLYPPLDDTSNDVGDRGSAQLQDQLVGQRWEGRDVPASILEAGELFASRMRMSRSLKQLWDVREKYIKFERGWDGDAKISHLPASNEEEASDDGTESSDEDNTELARKLQSLDDGDLLASLKISEKATPHEPVEIPKKETEDEDIQERLDAIEAFYRNALPHLQSLVIVFLKVILSNISALGSEATIDNVFADPEGRGDMANEESWITNNFNLVKHLNGNASGIHWGSHPGDDRWLDEFNANRLREITTKAITSTLLLMLKWFRLSHILKFEYLTQLMLDSNYLPLALKFFALQDVDYAVDHRSDYEFLDFFSFCGLNAGGGPWSPSPRPESPAPRPESLSSSNSDDAAPPPIRRHRQSTFATSPPPSPGSSPPPQPPPENSDSTQPVNGPPPPPVPITDYAPRFFHNTITLLRLLQKLSKGHAHRQLLLVQYKSSTILRRALKIPQPHLRLYTLKLFKAQTPYCGRKWRQTNMRVITAIYLHCRMELRDEWIAGGGMEDVLDEAVPLEQAGRALVHWWHLRHYRGAIAGEGEPKVEEDDFFRRELERMGWGPVEAGEEQEWEPDVGEVQLEGW